MSDSEDEEHDMEPISPPETLPLFPKDADGQTDDDEVWSGEELERAYQEAMSTLDHIEQELPDSNDDEGESVQSLNDFPSLADVPPEATENSGASPVSGDSETAIPRLQPAQIIEAALFVGGMPLTIKRLSGVLRDEFDREFIERVIDDLNLRYDDENRPYEIRLEEGGYRMVLRPEFHSVRNKSYGFGPKEVRLSQDALEVLALVAYQQPITKEDIEKNGKPRPNGALRQLLRREIIGLERTGKSAKDVRYHTTPRFLQIFGLADLSELPRSEDLTFK